MPGFVTCGPNEALVISGCCHSKPYLMPGGRVFVWPWLQKIQKISLNTMTLSIESPNVYSNNGVPISLTGISQVKVSGNNAERLLSAAENFLGKTEQEIINIVKETLEGHQREVIAKMTVDKIYKERKEFSKQVYQTASSDLADMGLVVVSYTVKDIHDKEGYLESLGLSQTAKVTNDAKKDEIEEFKERKIKELNADKEHYIAKFRNETQISKAQHDFNLKKAEYDISISQEKAKSDLANELQEEIGQKALIKETTQIENENKFNFEDISEKRKEIKKLELKCRVEELADSEYEKVKIVANATKNKIEEDCKTEVEIVKLIGDAQAYSLEKISKAQTEVMAKEASAYSEFTSAAKINMLLDVLPKIAAEISEPVSKCNKITMVSQGDGEVGINKIVTEVLDVVTKVYSSVNHLSNIANTGDNNPGQTPLLPLERKISSTPKSTFLGTTFGTSRT